MSKQIQDAYIVAATRTPIGKSHRGFFRNTRPDDLLAHARFGSLPIVAAITAVNGIAEELLFRGALFAAITKRWRVIASAALYGLATVLSGVPLLVLAAVALGLLTGLQRRVTGGVLGPIVTHLTWSLGMLFALPWALDLWT